MKEQAMQERFRKDWYVLYTRSRWEKKADQLLRDQGINSFCPVVRTKRKWADRTKMVEFPLFNSYLFVQIDQREHMKVRQTMGIVNFVYHCGKPATIREEEINRIRSLINRYPEMEAVSLPHLNIGDRVRIKDSSLFNCEGEIIEIQGKSVVMVIEPLNCALVAKLKVSPAELAVW